MRWPPLNMWRNACYKIVSFNRITTMLRWQKNNNKNYQLVEMDRRFVVYLKVSIRAITFYTNYAKHIVVPHAENEIVIHISMHIS